MRRWARSAIGFAQWAWAVHNATLDWGADIFDDWLEDYLTVWDQRKDQG